MKDQIWRAYVGELVSDRDEREGRSAEGVGRTAMEREVLRYVTVGLYKMEVSARTILKSV